MGITKEHYNLKGHKEKCIRYTLDNGQISVGILNYGAIIQSIITPDQFGVKSDIVLGYDDVNQYLTDTNYFGAIIGRNANRISFAALKKSGIALERNDGENNLHSGSGGLNQKFFVVTEEKEEDCLCLKLTCRLKDWEDGFPGSLDVTIFYRLKNDHQLSIKYHLVSDQETVINPTSHSYFNLGGHDSGSVLNHILSVNSHLYTPIKAGMCPTGEILQTSQTPFDFSSPKVIGKCLDLSHEQLRIASGFDHNFVINGEGLRPVAVVFEPLRGRVVEVYSDRPGVQFYTGNFIKHTMDNKDQAHYGPHCGFCLETQAFPDSANINGFSKVYYGPGEIFESETIYRFDTKNSI